MSQYMRRRWRINKFYTTTDDLDIRYLKEDHHLKNHILVGTDSAIYTLNLNSKEMYGVAGTFQKGYKEGVGYNARFNRIAGITTSPHNFPMELLVSDSANYCIRSVKRGENKTSMYAGQCRTKGNLDGLLLDARFGVLGEIVTNSHKLFEVIVCDHTAKHLKRIEYRSSTQELEVTGFLQYRYDSHNLGMGFDSSDEKIYLGFSTGIWWFQQDPFNSDTVLDRVGYFDGSLSTSSVNYPINFLFLSKDVMIVVDDGNYKLRVINLWKRRVSSICQREYSPELVKGAISACILNSPTYLLKHPTKDKILISVKDGICSLSYTDNRIITKRLTSITNPGSWSGTETEANPPGSNLTKVAALSKLLDGNAQMYINIAAAVSAVLFIVTISYLCLNRKRRQQPVPDPVSPANHPLQGVTLSLINVPSHISGSTTQLPPLDHRMGSNTKLSSPNRPRKTMRKGRIQTR